jgi:HEAT repeat protein
MALLLAVFLGVVIGVCGNGIIYRLNRVSEARLLRQLRSGDVVERLDAATSLGGEHFRNSQRGTDALIAALDDSPDAVALAAAGALIRRGDTEQLLVALDTGGKGARKAAALALGLAKEARATPALLKKLDDSDGEVRAAASEALGLLGDARAVTGLQSALSDPSRWVRLKAAAALVAMIDYRGQTVLIAGLDDADFRYRVEAVRALAGVPGPDATTALAKATCDTSQYVAENAFVSLGKRRDSGAIACLIEALATRGEGWARIAAAKALGDAGDPAAVGPLVAAVHGGTAGLDWPAIVALSKIGGPEAEALIEERLREGRPGERYELRMMLQAMDARKTVKIRSGPSGSQQECRSDNVSIGD